MKRIVAVTAATLLLGAAGGVSFGGETAPAADAPGKAIFLKNACNSCHSIAAQGIAKKPSTSEGEATATKEATPAEGAAAKEAAPTKEAAATTEAAAAGTEKRKPPDLSAVGLERQADWMVKYLQKLEAIKEKKHMKKFKGTDEELTQLAAWLASQKDAEAAKKAGEASLKEEVSKEGTKAEAAAATTEETKKGEATK
jgi:cbb3-type cytochrome oxidase cytochrome c subunit